MKNRKIYELFDTDFYQLTMGFSYVISGKNKEKTGFEGFVRHIKPSVNPNKNFYVFDGEIEVHNFMDRIRKELNDPKLCDTFIELVSDAITSENKEELIETFRENWEFIDKDFEYNVIPNGSLVFPMVPVFQFYGDKLIGQLIETRVTNIYNGKTGLATLKYIKADIPTKDFKLIKGVVKGKEKYLSKYSKFLTKRAKEFRNASETIILEAAFRRAPSLEVAIKASEIAIKEKWNGTSNVAAYQRNLVQRSDIGGSMAHAFVMSYETEKQAIIDYDKIFPGSTILIDTFDVVNCAYLVRDLVKNGQITKPKMVRIDSDPLEEYIPKVREILNEFDIGIFVSGDMTPERLQQLNGYSAAMAGTQYVYDDDILRRVNCGFVYKIVQFNRKGRDFYPIKKAFGKKNYPSLKNIKYDKENNTLLVNLRTNEMNISDIEKVNSDTTITVIENA